MQDIQSLSSSFFQRRKHKLFRALCSPPAPAQCSSPRHHLVSLYDTASNKQNQISQLNYFLKHEFNCDPTPFSHQLMQIIWRIMQIRSGSIASFIIYRICRKYPQLFWKLYEIVQANMQNQPWTFESISFYTDLYLYGFPFTLEDFRNKIFPHFKSEIIDLVPQYQEELGNNLNFPGKYQKLFKNQVLEWLEEERTKIMTKFEELRKMSENLQHSIVLQTEDQSELINYEIELEQYETLLHRFDLASSYLLLDFSPAALKLKPIFLLKKECQTYKTSIGLSPYEQSLYFSSGKLTQVNPLKKHEMLKLSQSDAFINKIKLCSTVDECLNLSGYFLEQMNLQRNREHLIETLINQCYNYNNISYILKIAFEIGQLQPSIREYCQSKAKKICANCKMNQKYQKLLCEMSKFNLIDESIILEYCEKIIKNENSQNIRQIEYILEQLGTIVYYRSLQTHIRINALFDKIQSIIKNRLNQYSIEHLYQLKGVVNFLRNHAGPSAKIATKYMPEIELKQNFTFILQKMKRSIKDKQNKEVLEYLVVGIDNEVYLTSYYYASLLRELSCRQLEEEIHRIAVETVTENVKEDNCQKAVCWSRFLGELYNYQCINRKEYLGDLMDCMKRNSDTTRIAGALKCVCSALETSKGYLKSNNPKRQREVILFLLELKIFYLRARENLQFGLNCQFQDILQFFNPYLLAVLNTEEEIDIFIQFVGQDESKNAISVTNQLILLAQGATFEQLSKNESENKKKYREKQPIESPQKKWVEKEIKSQRVQPMEVVSQSKRIPQADILTQESVTLHQSARVEVKKMKFMGRSKRDNKIKQITCTVTVEPQEL